LNTYKETEILDGILQYYTFPDNIFTGSEASLSELELLLEASKRLER